MIPKENNRIVYIPELFRYLVSFLLIICGTASSVDGKDFYVRGKVTDLSGNNLPGATISMIAADKEFRAVSGPDGSYTLKLQGIYSSISGLLEPGSPYPNPFSSVAYIPFLINSSGDIRFSVFSLSGRKIAEILFPAVQAGSYRIKWDGCNNSGAPVSQGLYVYAVTFRGQTWSGRLIKASGTQSSSSGSYLESVMVPSGSYEPPSLIRLKVLTTTTCRGYFAVSLTDIVIRRDTIIDFELTELLSLPFKTQDDHIAMFTTTGYRPLILKGINLGSSPPGTFPGEIAYAISGDDYEKWIRRIGEAGFNCIRVYTLHPPVFYEKLANYNYRNPGKPILLFQGIWLDEVESRSSVEFDLTLRASSFLSGIKEVIDCIHGNNNIALRPGRAYGNYKTDISLWTAAYIIGREVSPQEIITTNLNHSSSTSYSGSQFSITGATASEVFVTTMLDDLVKYEKQSYAIMRPVSMSSWPTLDPLIHPTEMATDEDKAMIDINKISGKSSMAGIFATYHAYPYYPNFVSLQPSYQAYSDDSGPNSYSGYITDLKRHYSDIPLVIGEFGVPSSWGSAHQSYSNMDHGGYSETQQGERNIRMMHNIIDANCAGGFMFSWMDEWFKPTWIVQYLESFGFDPGTGFIPTRQLWHNLTSPEQNFGLLGFDQKEILPFADYSTDNPAGHVQKASATHDNSFFYVNIEFRKPVLTGDTLIVAFDTYSASKGESLLPGGHQLTNRSEFILQIEAGRDTALLCVAEAYDMKGLTSRFDLSDPLIQKYRSILSDRASWKLMQWINDETEKTVSNIGQLPVENRVAFTAGERCAVAWSGNQVKIRIPWTFLHFYDPTRMDVIDGAVSEDGGWTYRINPSRSDGIGLSLVRNGEVISTTSRYTWDSWLVVPSTIQREKKSLQVVETGLSSLPDFAN